jgi:hypothetical protein
MEEVDRIGVCAPAEEALGKPMSPVHKGLIFGKSPGDETWFLREMSQRGVVIILGGDEQSMDEARDIIRRDPTVPSSAVCRARGESLTVATCW